MPNDIASLKEYKKKWYEKNKERLLKKRKKYYEKHKDEILAREKKYKKDNEEKLKARRIAYYKENRAHITGLNTEIRMTVLKHYGGTPPKCACCGESHLEFLAIDHIKGGGIKERKGPCQLVFATSGPSLTHFS